MTNDKLRMIKGLQNYFIEWWTIMARPIYFYTKLKETSWKEESLSFLLVTSWILAAVVTLAIFIVQYVPIGATLVEGTSGIKFLIILPVLVTLALVFWALTYLILGGVTVVVLCLVFYAIGFILHYVYLGLGGKGSLNRMAQSCFYSTAVVGAGFFPAAFAVLTRYRMLELSLFRVGYNLVYALTILFVYGLWAVAGRKAYGVPKWKAFAGALVPVIILLIFGFLFDKIALSKIETWIVPLK
jgi:hypothetical protein